MARREVIEIACDRCGKVETQSKGELPNHSISPGEVQPEFQFRYHKTFKAYGDLCRKCRRTLGNYVEKIISHDNKNQDA